MIQSILFFSLGFLCAFLLALMVAPAIWRRAVTLTQRRLEATMPQSPSAIAAEKDQVRADFALQAHRLEQDARTAREKAAGASVDLGRRREEIKQLSTEIVERDARIAELEAHRAGLEDELSGRDRDLKGIQERLDEALARLATLQADYETLDARHAKETHTSSTRKAELQDRDGQIEKLTGEITTLRNERKESDKKFRGVLSDNKAAQEALRNERKRATDLEGRIERLLKDLSDREERLERREKDLARLKDDHRAALERETMAEQQIQRVTSERARLDDEIASLTDHVAALMSGATDKKIEEAARKLRQDRRRLEERLAILTRENNQLRENLGSSGTDDNAQRRRETDVLRDQLTELAAEIVHLTALVDTPDSAIRKALDAEDQATGSAKPSLADRIRALQKAAAFPGSST